MVERNDKGEFSGKYELSGELKELYEDYGEWVTLNTEKETTIDRLKAGVRAWMHWCVENDNHPYDVGEDEVRRYIKWMQLEEYADTTISRRFASVSKYYHFLRTDPDTNVGSEENPTRRINLRRDYEIRNQTEYVRVLDQEGRDDIIALPYEQIEPIFDNVPGKRAAIRVRNKLVCLLFWQTAVRSDELSRIRIKNVEPMAKVNGERKQLKGTIKVRSSKLNRKDHPKLYHRRVFFEKNLEVLMRRWESKREELVAGEDCPYYIVSENGTQMEPSTLSRMVKDAAHNAGVNEPLVRDKKGKVEQWLFTAHRLRHSRITYLANDANGGKGMNLNSLRMMAGHVSFDTTLSYVDTDWMSAHRDYFRAVEGQ